MIVSISGTLIDKAPTSALIEAGGLGYQVHIPASSFDKLPAKGKPARLLTTFVVREDSQTLYGFATDAERQTFETLIGVSGVGPKLALAALSALSPTELRDVVVAGDVAMLTRVPGVGKRKAEKLIVELKDKMLKLDGLEAASGGDATLQAARADARAGLEGLGLARAEAEKRLRKILRENPGLQSAEDMIRLALRA